MSDVREKKSKCQKKNFQVFEKKMNDKRNSIYGNVMLLSQSRGEISLSAFAKKKEKLGLSQKRKKMFDLKRNALIQRLLINTSFMTWSPCCDRMKPESNFELKSH